MKTEPKAYVRIVSDAQCAVAVLLVGVGLIMKHVNYRILNATMGVFTLLVNPSSLKQYIDRTVFIVIEVLLSFTAFALLFPMLVMVL